MRGSEREAATVQRARSLRKSGTMVENRLWYVLRNRNLDGLKFTRQVPIGPYFVDFLCAEAGLVVELDGGQHSENASDTARTSYLNREGYAVLRFWNNEVNSNRAAVLQAILDTVAGHPSPDLRFAQATLSPTGRGTRGERAARAAFAARHLSETPTFPLPVGERVDRPQAETGEGFQGTYRDMP